MLAAAAPPAEAASTGALVVSVLALVSPLIPKLLASARKALAGQRQHQLHQTEVEHELAAQLRDELRAEVVRLREQRDLDVEEQREAYEARLAGKIARIQLLEDTLRSHNLQVPV